MNLGSRHTQAWVESRSTVNYTGFPKDPIGKNGKVSKFLRVPSSAHFWSYWGLPGFLVRRFSNNYFIRSCQKHLSMRTLKLKIFEIWVWKKNWLIAYYQMALPKKFENEKKQNLIKNLKIHQNRKRDEKEQNEFLLMKMISIQMIRMISSKKSHFKISRERLKVKTMLQKHSQKSQHVPYTRWWYSLRGDRWQNHSWWFMIDLFDDSSSLLIRPPGGEIFWVLLKN